MKTRIENILKKLTIEIARANKSSAFVAKLETPDNPEHGDFASPMAMQYAKVLKKNPREIAELIVSRLKEELKDDAEVEIAGPGFVNIKVSKDWFASSVIKIIEDKDFFKNNLGQEERLLVEFVSANPTGPLHVGHGRGAAYGDSLCRLLSRSGYIVTAEYYVNDAGNQMKILGKSVYHRALEIEDVTEVLNFPEDGYKGDYIKDIARKIYDADPELLKVKRSEGMRRCLVFAIKEIRAGIEKDLKDFRVHFDSWFSEKNLYDDGSIEIVLEQLKEAGETYEKDGALWLKTRAKGDDKDRVLRKSTGEYTYFTPDIAYHKSKFDRGNTTLIDVLGADHHGYVRRMRCAIDCLGYKEEYLDVTLVQTVSLVKNNEKINMSTRSGAFIPLSWLIEEVGVDAARYFYNMRSFESQFDFDIDLAKSKSNDNPVYYIQYAHARVHSLIANAKDKGIEYKAGYGLDKVLGKDEINLIRKMVRLKYVIEHAAKLLEPHRIAHYLSDLAGTFHNYYYNNKILDSENVEESCGKLTICEALAVTIKEGLDILGVSAPTRM